MGRDALRKANLSQQLISSINICRATTTSNQSSRAQSLHFIYVGQANFPYKTYAISASAEREPNGSHFHYTAVNYWTLTEVGSHFSLSIRELMPLKSWPNSSIQTMWTMWLHIELVTTLFVSHHREYEFPYVFQLSSQLCLLELLYA